MIKRKNTELFGKFWGFLHPQHQMIDGPGEPLIVTGALEEGGANILLPGEWFQSKWRHASMPVGVGGKENWRSASGKWSSR